MHDHPALDRLSLPPPDMLQRRRKADSRDVGYIFTPMAFVVSVIVAMLTIAIVVTLVAIAPQLVLLPLAVTVAIGLLARPLLARNRRWFARRHAVWAALALGGTSLAVLALTLPEVARAALVATAVAALLMVRVVAMYRGWDPRAAARAAGRPTTAHSGTSAQISQRS